MARVDYSPRFLTGTYLERERDNALRLGVYRDGAIVTPTSGTLYVYNASGVLVAQVTVDVAASFATATVQASGLASQSRGGGWRVEWHLLMPDGYTHVFRNAAALCRVALPPAASVDDLLVWHADLNAYLPAGQESWQPQGDLAWADILLWLEGKGRRPYLVIDGNALRPLHTWMWLERVCSVLGADGDDSNKWVRLEAKYAEKAKGAKEDLSFEYDETDEGRASASNRVAAEPTVWLCAAGEDW